MPTDFDIEQYRVKEEKPIEFDIEQYRVKDIPVPSYPRAVWSGIKGGAAFAPGLIEKGAKLVGAPEAITEPLTSARKYLEPSEEEMANVEALGIPGKIAYGVGEALPTIPTFLIPGAGVAKGLQLAGMGAKLARTIAPIATFGGIEALQASEEGPAKVFERGLIGGATGAALHALGPLGLLKRAAGMGTLFGGQAAVEGLRQGLPLPKALEEAIPSTVIGAGMGLVGGRRRVEPEIRPEPTRVAPAETLPMPLQLEWKRPELEWWRGLGAKGVEGIPIPPELERLALPPGQGFLMEEPPPTIIRRPPEIRGKLWTPEAEPTPTAPGAVSPAGVTPPPAETPPRPAPGMPPTLGAEPGVDLFRWVKDRGGLDPTSRGADLIELTQKESGFRGMASLVRKGGRKIDELAQEAAFEGLVPPGTDAEGFVQILKDRVRGGPKGPSITENFIQKAEAEWIKNKDPEWLREDTRNNLTAISDDEIMGWKEEKRLEGWSEKDIARGLEEAQRAFDAEEIPSDIEGIKGILKTAEVVTKPELSPTEKAQYKLPGMKIGVEAKVAPEAPPTIEGSPLMQAAIKAEREKAQPTLFDIAKSGRKEITREEMMNLPDVKAGRRTPENMEAYLEGKGVKVAAPPPPAETVMAPPPPPPGPSFIRTTFVDDKPVYGGGPGTHAGDVIAGVGKIPEDAKIETGWTRISESDPTNPRKGFYTNEQATEMKAIADREGVPIDAIKFIGIQDMPEGKTYRNYYNLDQPGHPKDKSTLTGEERAKFATGERPQAPLSPDVFQRVVDTHSLKNSPDKRILDSPNEIPDRILRQIPENERPNIKGVYDPVERLTYLVKENIGSEKELRDIVDHEDIKHHAVDLFLEKKGEADKWFNRVYLKYGREGLKDIAIERGFDLNTPEGRREAAREKIARTPIEEAPGVIKQFWAWLREKLAKIFPGMKVSDAEIQRTFQQATDAMARGELLPPDPAIEGMKEKIREIRGAYAQRAQFATTPKEVGRKFAEEDLIPKVAQMKEGFRASLRSLINVLVPRAGVPRESLDVIMEKKGHQEQLLSEFVVRKTNQDVKDRLGRLPQADQVSFIDRIKRGQTQPTFDLQQMADFVKTWDRTIGEEYRAYKPGMSWQQDHFRVLWKILPRGSEKLINELQGEIYDLKQKPQTPNRVEKIGALEAQVDWIRNGVGEGKEQWQNWWSKKPLEGTRGYFKQHTLEDMSEGIGFGGVPHSYNAMDLLQMHYADALKFISSQAMWKGLGDINAKKFVRVGEKPPDGFIRLNDRIARVFFKTPEGMVQAGEWWVEEGAGRLLNNYLSRDLIREHPLGRAAMGLKNMTTAMELALSPFHLMFETIETVASQAGLGMRKIWNQGLIAEGLKDIVTAPKAFLDIARAGGSVVKMISDPKEFLKTTRGEDFLRKFPNAPELIADLFTGGAKLGLHEDYRIRAIETLKANVNSKNYIGAALRSIPALNEMMMKPLFETYIPRLKIGLFLKEYSNELRARDAELTSGKITRPELARTVWDFVENRLGEMNFDNLFWDRTFKSSLQFLVRSVTWKMGNIRSYGRAITEQSREFVSALREGRKPMLTQEMAWAWGVAATTAAIASIAQYAYTGKWPTEAKDLVYPKIDEEGNRISLPTYMRDLFHVSHAPGRYVWSSLSGWVGRLSDVLQNRDFYGAQIHDPEENIISQRVDDLIHLVPLPFSIQSFKAMKEKGEPFEKEITGFLGATKAPYWIEKSAAQQLATELAGAKIPAGGMSRADRARTDLIKTYARQYQQAEKRSEPTAEILSNFQADLQSGKLQPKDILRFRQRITREPLEQSVLRLTLKEALRVWDKATDEEKIKLAPYVLRKFRGSRSPEEREEALPKVQEIAGGR